MQYLKIKPGDLAIITTIAIVLLTMSAGCSVWPLMIQRIEITRLKSKLSEIDGKKCESAKIRLERTAKINQLKSDSAWDIDSLVYPEFSDAHGTTGSDKKRKSGVFHIGK